MKGKGYRFQVRCLVALKDQEKPTQNTTNRAGFETIFDWSHFVMRETFGLRRLCSLDMLAGWGFRQEIAQTPRDEPIPAPLLLHMTTSTQITLACPHSSSPW